MAAPSKLFVLWDEEGFATLAESREELDWYIMGSSEEHVYEYQFVQEHPINVDLQQDPEGN